MRFLAVLSLFCCFISCQTNPITVFKNEDPKNLFPLALGNSWTLTSYRESLPGTYTMTVVGDTILDGNEYFVMRHTSHDSDQTYSYFARIDSRDRIWLVEGGSRLFILDPTEQEYEHNNYLIKVTHPYLLETNVGIFIHGVNFYIDHPQIADEETGYIFFPGVGLICIYGSWGRDYRLVSYELK